MSDRHRQWRRFNLVVYNFSEGADRKVDTKAFQTLCMHAFNLDLSIVKSVCLGPKINNTHRPLLLTVEDLEDKIYRIAGFSREDFNLTFWAIRSIKICGIFHLARVLRVERL